MSSCIRENSCINSIEHAKPKNSDEFKLNPSIISKKIDDLTLFGILESCFGMIYGKINFEN